MKKYTCLKDYPYVYLEDSIIKESIIMRKGDVFEREENGDFMVSEKTKTIIDIDKTKEKVLIRYSVQYLLKLGIIEN